MPQLKFKHDTRVETFLKEYAKNNNIAKSGRIAGYAETYVTKQPHKILERALRYQIYKATNALQDPNTTTKDIKDSLKELIGLDSQQIGDEYKKIVTQDRDISTKFKALIPLLREQGIDVIDPDRQNTIIPVMNITVRERTDDTMTHIREIEPPIVE